MMALNKFLAVVVFVFFVVLFSTGAFAVELYPGINMIGYRNITTGHFYLRNVDNKTATVRISPHNFSDVFEISPGYVNISPGATVAINYTANLSRVYDDLNPGVNSLGIDSYILSSESYGGTINSMVVLTYVLKVIKPMVAKDIYVKSDSYNVVSNHDSSLELVVQNRGNESISHVNATLFVGNNSFSSNDVNDLSQSQVKTLSVPVFLNYSTGSYDAKLYVNYDHVVLLKNVTIAVINDPFKVYDFYSDVDNNSVFVTFSLKNDYGKDESFFVSTSCYPYTTDKDFSSLISANSYKFFNYTLPIVYNYNGNLSCKINISSDLSDYSFTFVPVAAITNASVLQQSKTLNSHLVINLIIITIVLIFCVIFGVVLLKNKRNEGVKKNE